jgi:PBP1b-binding outer membrane lipoprotein LpoB
MKKQIVAAALGASILILTGCGDKAATATETAQPQYEVPPATQKLGLQDLEALRKVPGNSIPPVDTAAAEKEKQELLDRVQRIERELADQKAKAAEPQKGGGDKPPAGLMQGTCGRNCDDR